MRSVEQILRDQMLAFQGLCRLLRSRYEWFDRNEEEEMGRFLARYTELRKTLNAAEAGKKVLEPNQYWMSKPFQDHPQVIQEVLLLWQWTCDGVPLLPPSPSKPVN